MENNQTTPPENQIIDLTIKSFLVEICKYLKVFYISGIVIISACFIKIFTYILVEPFIRPLYKSNRRLHDFITDFYFKNNHFVIIFILFLITTSAFTYRKSLVKALNSNNQNDLIDSFYKLKMLFRTFAIFLIISFFSYLFYFAMNFYHLTYH